MYQTQEVKGKVLYTIGIGQEVAVTVPFGTTWRPISLRTCSQSVTRLRLRPMQIRDFRTTSLLSLPLLTTNPMALVLPTWTGRSLGPRKLQLFSPMLPPKPPVSSSEFMFCEYMCFMDFFSFCLLCYMWGFQFFRAV